MSVEERLAALEARVSALEDRPIEELARHNAGKAAAIRRLGLRVDRFDRAFLYYVTPRTEIPTVRCIVCGCESAAARLPQGLVHAGGCAVDAGR